MLKYVYICYCVVTVIISYTVTGGDATVKNSLYIFMSCDGTRGAFDRS